MVVTECHERADRYSPRGAQKVPTYSAIAGRRSHTNARPRRRAGLALFTARKREFAVFATSAKPVLDNECSLENLQMRMASATR